MHVCNDVCVYYVYLRGLLSIFPIRFRPGFFLGVLVPVNIHTFLMVPFCPTNSRQGICSVQLPIPDNISGSRRC